jgi:nucleoside-diphosphate-sugar epimerase
MNKKNLKPVYTDPRPTDIRHGYADITKAQRILGFHPKIFLKDGLKKLVNWYVGKK